MTEDKTASLKPVYKVCKAVFLNRRSKGLYGF